MMHGHTYIKFDYHLFLLKKFSAAQN